MYGAFVTHYDTVVAGPRVGPATNGLHEAVEN